MAPTPALPSLPGGARDPFAGRLNHLTEEQTAALEDFRAQITSNGLYTPATSTSRASHDEVTLLRFLRARKFDVPGAVHQFSDTEAWRKEQNVNEMFDAFDVQEFATSQEVYTQWTGRRAKSGQPLYVYKIGGLTKDKVNAYSAKADRLLPRMIVLSEMMTAFVLPFCSALPRPHDEIPVDATVCIVDIADVSLSRFWALRSHMQRASTMATAYYPETLGAIFIVGAPGFFSVVWGWIGKWFDPGTVEKIFILPSHEVLPTLTKHVDISNIPKRYGGELAWDFGDPVSLDAEGAAKVGLVEGTPLPRGTVRWGPDGFQLVGTGRTPEEIAQGTPAPREKAPIANGNGNAVKKDEGAEVFSDDDEEENWSIAEEGNDEDLADVTAKVGQL